MEGKRTKEARLDVYSGNLLIIDPYHLKEFDTTLDNLALECCEREFESILQSTVNKLLEEGITDRQAIAKKVREETADKRFLPPYLLETKNMVFCRSAIGDGRYDVIQEADKIKIVECEEQDLGSKLAPAKGKLIGQTTIDSGLHAILDAATYKIGRRTLHKVYTRTKVSKGTYRCQFSEDNKLIFIELMR